MDCLDVQVFSYIFFSAIFKLEFDDPLVVHQKIIGDNLDLVIIRV